MGYFVEQHWPANLGAYSSRARQPGRYRAYVPSKLIDVPLVVPQETQLRVTTIERRISSINIGQNLRGLDVLTRFLARREAVASSAIEGLQVSMKQLALAEVDAALQGSELLPSEPPWGETNASLVLSNIRAVNEGVDHLVETHPWRVEDLERVQALLVSPDLRGVRVRQNWVGGHSGTPIGAEFVPPPPKMLPDLLEDLVAYASGGLHSPLIQAALVHAQFETLHPFADGNGRTGRALIHAVLKRRLPTQGIILPISAALAARSHEYISGLMRFRLEAEAGSPDHTAAVDAWLTTFLDASEAAIEIVTDLARQVSDLKSRWHEEFSAFKSRQGRKREVRSDAGPRRIYDEILVSMPALTPQMVVEALGNMTEAGARRALTELVHAGILTAHKHKGKVVAYYCKELFELINHGELNLASSQYDAVASPPPKGRHPAS